jgi:hypothetical protein
MQQYRIASWILLILSIFNFTLAAPIAVQDGQHRALINAVDEAKDRTVALQQRGPDKGQSSDPTSNPTSDPISDPGAPPSGSVWDLNSYSNPGPVSELDGGHCSDGRDGGVGAGEQGWEMPGLDGQPDQENEGPPGPDGNSDGGVEAQGLSNIDMEYLLSILDTGYGTNEEGLGPGQGPSQSAGSITDGPGQGPLQSAVGITDGPGQGPSQSADGIADGPPESQKPPAPCMTISKESF